MSRNRPNHTINSNISRRHKYRKPQNYCSNRGCDKLLTASDKAHSYNAELDENNKLCVNCAYEIAKDFWEYLRHAGPLKNVGWKTSVEKDS